MSSVCFRIHSSSLNPDSITARLGIQPSRTFEKGSLLSPRIKSARRHAALWILEGSSPNLPLSEQLRELVSLIEAKHASLSSLANQCLYDVFCAFTPTDGERMLILEPDLLRKLEIVPIDLVIDFIAETE